jgi:hypothetical protein
MSKPGTDHPAQEDAVLIDQVDRHRGAEIGHDDRILDHVVRRRGRHDAVRADLARLIHPHGDRQGDVLADHADILPEVLLGDLADHFGPGGLDAADDDHAVALALPRALQDRDLPPCLDQALPQFRFGLPGQGADEILLPVQKEADADIRISNVYSDYIHKRSLAIRAWHLLHGRSYPRPISRPRRSV